MSRAAAAPRSALLPIDLQAPIRAVLIYTLTYPTIGGASFRVGDDSASSEWQSEVRALVGASDSPTPTHIVCSADDGLSNTLASVFQERRSAHGLEAAMVAHASDARSAAAMLDELVATVWESQHQDRDAESDSDDEDNEAMATPVVCGRVFCRSVRATPLPRILLLAPSMDHAFNESLHRRILALDSNANLQVNTCQTHTFVSKKTEEKEDGSNSSPDLVNSPQVPFESSVFSVPLAQPVLLEYSLYRSVHSGVWSDMSRLQRVLERTIGSSIDGVLAGPKYPDPIREDLNRVYIARHTRVYTRHTTHDMRRVVLVPAELIQPDTEMLLAAEQPTTATNASTAETTLAAAAVAVAVADIDRLDVKNLARVRDLFGHLVHHTVLSAWSGPRLVCFDSSPAGRATSALLAREFPSFAFTAQFVEMVSAMGVYELMCSSPRGTPIVLVGNIADLPPIASLLIHGGRRTGGHALVSKQVLRDAFTRHGVLELEHCSPDLPTSLLHTRDIPATEIEQLKFQVTKILNESLVPLASLKT